MGLYNFYKILKDMFRTIFGKHFLKLLLIAILLFIGYIIFSVDKVEAATSSILTADDSIFSNEDISRARSLIGDTIWNNDNYDILLVFNGYSYAAGSVTYNNGVADINYGKTILYYDTSTLNADNFQISTSSIQNLTQHNISWRSTACYLQGTSVVGTTYLNYFYRGANGTNQNYTTTISFNVDGSTPNQNTIYIKPIRLSYDILDSNNDIIVKKNKVIPPYFVTTNQELETFDFDYFQINGGTSPYYTELAEGVGGAPKFSLRYIYKGVTTNIDVTDYVSVNESENTWSINIPYTKLVESVIVRNGESFSYAFDYFPFFGTGYSFSTGTLTYNITTEKQNEINEDSLRALESSINQGQQKTTDALTSSDYDKNDINNILSFETGLSGLDVVTALQNLFHTVELAFVSNDPIDIVFTVPFTNAQFVIPYNYTEEHLPLSGRVMLSTIWFGLVSLWCFKRVMTIVDFVEEGDFDMIFKNGDVKKEVL